MKKFIFGEKNSIHIIDLTQTVDFIKIALTQVHKVISNGGKILVVSTKKQASEQVSDLAKETGQFYVNFRISFFVKPRFSLDNWSSRFLSLFIEFWIVFQLVSIPPSQR